MPLKDLCTEFNETGICKIDVDKTCASWTDKMLISWYAHKYFLVKFGKGSNNCKIQISIAQATEIIKRINLLRIQSSLINNACTYKRESIIKSEIERFLQMINEKENELTILERERNIYSNALAKRPITSF